MNDTIGKWLKLLIQLVDITGPEAAVHFTLFIKSDQKVMKEYKHLTLKYVSSGLALLFPLFRSHTHDFFYGHMCIGGISIYNMYIFFQVIDVTKENFPSLRIHQFYHLYTSFLFWPIQVSLNLYSWLCDHVSITLSCYSFWKIS